jgi:hypothetical protein
MSDSNPRDLERRVAEEWLRLKAEFVEALRSPANRRFERTFAAILADPAIRLGREDTRAAAAAQLAGTFSAYFADPRVRRRVAEAKRRLGGKQFEPWLRGVYFAAISDALAREGEPRRIRLGKGEGSSWTPEKIAPSELPMREYRRWLRQEIFGNAARIILADNFEPGLDSSAEELLDCETYTERESKSKPGEGKGSTFFDNAKSDELDPLGNTLRSEWDAAVEAAKAELSDEDRHTLDAWLEAESPAALAAALNTSRGNAMRQVDRAVAKLRRVLIRRGFSPS